MTKWMRHQVRSTNWQVSAMFGIGKNENLWF
jgi:hypothetical protein